MKTKISKQMKWALAFTMTIGLSSGGTWASESPLKKLTPEKALRQGTDTGNGSGDQASGMNLSSLRGRRDYPEWCNAVEGLLSDLLYTYQMSPTQAQARDALQNGLSEIVASLQAGTVPLQPLTYSLLVRTLQMNEVFPIRDSDGTRSVLGDGAAIIVMHHLAQTAIRVNRSFDVPRYIPFYDHYRSGDCAGRNCYPEDNDPFYVDYLDSARETLASFFRAALPESRDRATVFDAMAKDRWELEAMSKLIPWLLEDIRRDIFGRRMECVAVRLEVIESRLQRYLGGESTAPFNDRTMRVYMEKSLEDTLRAIESATQNRGRCGGR